MAKPRRTLSKVDNSLRRSVEVRKPRKTLVVLCEGMVTEPEYLSALKRQPDVREVAAVELIIDTDSMGSVPLTLVNHAVTIKKRQDYAELEIDELWCVFDVEWTRKNSHHPNLHRALEKARDNGIFVAVSNPCFEVWLILHFADQQAFLDNDEARHARARYDGSDGKKVDAGKYMPLRDQAIRRARSLDHRHAANGTRFPHDNPSSGMYRLLESIKD